MRGVSFALKVLVQQVPSSPIVASMMSSLGVQRVGTSYEEWETILNEKGLSLAAPAVCEYHRGEDEYTIEFDATIRRTSFGDFSLELDVEVPDEIIRQGEEAVLEYVNTQMNLFPVLRDTLRDEDIVIVQTSDDWHGEIDEASVAEG